MAIYGRFGDPVEILRIATKDDVEILDGRKFDKHDADRLRYDALVVIRQDTGVERLYDTAFLKADDGAVEIATAVRLAKNAMMARETLPEIELYPDGWPRCGCGDFTLDGKATCGRVGCGPTSGKQARP